MNSGFFVVLLFFLYLYYDNYKKQNYFRLVKKKIINRRNCVFENDVVSEKITPSSVLFVIAEELFKLLPDSLHEVASPLNSNVQAKINAVILLRFPKNTFLIAVPPSK